MSDSIYLSMQSFGSDEDVATCLTTLAAHVNNLHSSFCTKFIWVDVSNVLYLFQPLVSGRYMHLQPNPKTAHIEAKPASPNVLAKLTEDQILETSVFVVQGITVGTTHLMFNATTTAGKLSQAGLLRYKYLTPSNCHQNT